MYLESGIQALHPLKVVVWGKQAMGFLGAVTLLNVRFLQRLLIIIPTNYTLELDLDPS